MKTDRTYDGVDATDVQIPWDGLRERGTAGVMEYLDGILANLPEATVKIVDVEPRFDSFEGGVSRDQLIVAAHGNADDNAVFHVCVVDYMGEGDGTVAMFINHAVLDPGVSVTSESVPYVDLDGKTLGVVAYIRDCLAATPGIVGVAWTPDGYWRYTGDGLLAEMDDDG